MENSSSWKNTQAGKTLESRLNDEQVVHTLNRILDRLDVIESSLSTIHEAPGMVSMIADITDDAISSMSNQGIDLDDRLKSALHIAEKLTAPSIVEKIDTFVSAIDQAPGMVSMLIDMTDDVTSSSSKKGIDIDERLKAALEIAEKLTAPQMVKNINNLVEFVNQAPSTISMVVDMADDTSKSAAERGVDIDERLRAGLEMAEKLTAPEMVKNINNLIEFANQAPSTISLVVDIADDTFKSAEEKGIDINDRLQSALVIAEKLTAPKVVNQLTGMLEMMDQSSGLVAMTTDSFDSIMQIAVEKGIDPQVFASQIFGVTTKLAELMSTDEMKEIVDGGIFDVQTLKIMNAASNALVETNQTPTKKVGLFGMVREMKNPNMQKALGFLTTFAQLFGKKLG